MLLKNVEKHELRSHFKRIRAKLEKSNKEELDLKLAERFLTSEQYIGCRVLFAYVSTPIEVDTSVIISSALADGKKVAVPKCDRDGNMEFYYITELSQLRKGMFSIMEPDVECCKKVKNYDNAVCLVPALSYDKSGSRLGFGKGCYDRFLSDFSGKKVGLIYECCICDVLPTESHDLPVDAVITEKEIYSINKNSQAKG